MTRSTLAAIFLFSLGGGACAISAEPAFGSGDAEETGGLGDAGAEQGGGDEGGGHREDEDEEEQEDEVVGSHCPNL